MLEKNKKYNELYIYKPLKSMIQNQKGISHKKDQKFINKNVEISCQKKQQQNK